MKAQALALSSPANQAEFRKGYDYVCKDVENGLTPDQSFDLASTPANIKRGAAFMSGANAARSMIGGDGAFARKLASAYGVNLDRP